MGPTHPKETSVEVGSRKVRGCVCGCGPDHSPNRRAFLAQAAADCGRGGTFCPIHGVLDGLVLVLLAFCLSSSGPLLLLFFFLSSSSCLLLLAFFWLLGWVWFSWCWCWCWLGLVWFGLVVRLGVVWFWLVGFGWVGFGLVGVGVGSVVDVGLGFIA